MRFLTTLLYEMDVIVELKRLLLESVPREPDGLRGLVRRPEPHRLRLGGSRRRLAPAEHGRDDAEEQRCRRRRRSASVKWLQLVISFQISHKI